ncbi:hypothetical protein SESBI_46180 [Sesbania bispinosa]|nr:hypothetical protein SESBI_46180 [Sesbania bispinosa]
MRQKIYSRRKAEKRICFLLSEPNKDKEDLWSWIFDIFSGKGNIHQFLMFHHDSPHDNYVF